MINAYKYIYYMYVYHMSYDMFKNHHSIGKKTGM